jgi:hypothetical protein
LSEMSQEREQLWGVLPLNGTLDGVLKAHGKGKIWARRAEGGGVVVYVDILVCMPLHPSSWRSQSHLSGWTVGPVIMGDVRRQPLSEASV